MDSTIQNERVIREIEGQPVALLLLKNYINAQLPLAKRGNAPSLSEIEEANQKGLGVSLNSIFFSRSLVAVQSGRPLRDASFLYNDLCDPGSWRGIPEFEWHLKTDEGSFNEGISFKDGFIFSFERGVLEGIIGDIPKESKLLFYHHKVVGGEPRGEFYSIIHELYGEDMRGTLSELFESRAVGSGTTSLVSDQCFGALAAGPFCKSRQYRLRKTKLSGTMDIGHLLIYECHLREKASEELARGGFDFSDVLKPGKSLAEVAHSLLESCKSVELVKRYRRPAELFSVNKMVVYAERDNIDEGNRIICRSRFDGSEMESDITGYIYDRNGFGGLRA